MKFAVRTITCLGCKTPLKPGSLSKSLSPILLSSKSDVSRRQRRLRQLPTSNCRATREASESSCFRLAPQSAHVHLFSFKSRLELRRLSRDCGRSASGARAPCTRYVSPFLSKMSADAFLSRTSFARARIAPSFTCARRRRRTSPSRSRSWNAVSFFS